jgi:alpha-L-arabinofuranosidase
VNIIAPIMTEPGGRAWRQTIFHPFADVANLASGETLRQAVESETFSSKSLGELAYLLSSTTHDRPKKRVCVFALNRHLSGEMEFSLELRGQLEHLTLAESRVLGGFDLGATNSAEAETVRPSSHPTARIDGSTLRARLQPGSWNVFVLRYAS